jgi:hypothetical protein
MRRTWNMTLTNRERNAVSISMDNWRDYAACKGADPEIFYPGQGEQGKEGLAFCDKCPLLVRTYCLNEGNFIRDPGTRGGLTASQREKRFGIRLRYDGGYMDPARGMRVTAELPDDVKERTGNMRPDQIEWMRTLRDHGWGMTAIAEEMGFSRTLIHRKLQAAD